MRKLILFFSILSVFSSCRTLNPQVMLQVPKNYPYVTDSAHVANPEYIISPGDRIEMHFFTIDGFKLVDVTNSVGSAGSEAINYLIEKDSLVKLPVIGRVKVSGKTVPEAERFLEGIYTKYYINPFIQLKVTNRHAYVFFADNGHGAIINIPNDNTSIIEVVALAGGLTDNSKAWRIKVVRGDLHNPTVHLIDLSTVEGMKASDLTVQSNDIIYVESTPNYKTKLLAQLTPFISIISSIFLIVTFAKTYK